MEHVYVYTCSMYRIELLGSYLKFELIRCILFQALSVKILLSVTLNRSFNLYFLSHLLYLK